MPPMVANPGPSISSLWEGNNFALWNALVDSHEKVINSRGKEKLSPALAPPAKRKKAQHCAAPSTAPASALPSSVTVEDAEQAIIVRFSLAGMDPEDIDVSIEPGKTSHLIRVVTERSNGAQPPLRFEQQAQIPISANCKQVETDFVDNILILTISKHQPAPSRGCRKRKRLVKE